MGMHDPPRCRNRPSILFFTYGVRRSALLAPPSISPDCERVAWSFLIGKHRIRQQLTQRRSPPRSHRLLRVRSRQIALSYFHSCPRLSKSTEYVYPNPPIILWIYNPADCSYNINFRAFSTLVLFRPYSAQNSHRLSSSYLNQDERSSREFYLSSSKQQSPVRLPRARSDFLGDR